jgi:hypothetical protein
MKYVQNLRKKNHPPLLVETVLRILIVVKSVVVMLNVVISICMGLVISPETHAELNVIVGGALLEGFAYPIDVCFKLHG